METLPTPDREHGLFETLLVLDGEPVALDPHLDRLGAGLAAVFGAELPAGLAGEAAERARGHELGRMRIVVTPDGEVSFATQTVDPLTFFPAQERGPRLRSVRCLGGLGAHKWADRRPLAETPSGPVSLLLDEGDEVLEASRGNVFAIVGQALFTPAADGRILPGTARAAVIEIAREAGIEVREGRLGRDELLGADGVVLTGSVRGIEPVHSLDGAELPLCDELSQRLAERLRRRWRTGRLAAARS
ncbi:MAG TPA: aminotransferase class IV [Solirubrobacterales bacterium]|nr:aminotransferase class IV [Solirubrobacterales bacterium]